MRHVLIVLCLALPFAAPLKADVQIGEITQVASGLKGPWSLAFLPSGEMLVTEKQGRLWRIGADGRKRAIKGMPQIEVIGQGGLLDVLVTRDFARSGRIYLSYVKSIDSAQGTAVASATLEGQALSDVRELYTMTTDSSGGRHFGGRLAEGRDGMIYLTLGDRGDRPSAQDPSRHNGMIMRIDPQSGKAVPWTTGHRNPQGLAFDARGQLWAHEHGARGGDEINRIERGKNYGWPVIAYGRHYSGGRIGEGTVKPGLEQPVFYWDPSIAPSGFAIHSGKGWPEMKGRFLVGSLKFDQIAVMAPGGAQQIGTIETRETQRVRDVRIGPQGGIWFLSEGNGALYRITPQS